MNHSQKFLHALELVDMVSFSVREVPVCDRGHVGCWRVSVVASGNVQGGLVRVYEGPFEHMLLPDALDLVATVASYHGTQLELLGQVRDDREPQLPLEGLSTE